MPANGETNQKFGFYKNLCCGKESVVLEGHPFPDCPNHPGLTTIWTPIVDHKIAQLGKRLNSDYRKPRFNVGDEVDFIAAGSQKHRRGNVIEIIESSVDYVYRYHVRLDNGTCIRCFGFELELIQDESARSA
jgi:hypothetical protein